MQGLSAQRPALVALCGAACLVALIVLGPIFQLSTSRVGTALGLGESTCQAILTSAINMVAPLHGGVTARAVYLKKRHRLTVSRFPFTFVGYNIYIVAVCCGIAGERCGTLPVVAPVQRLGC